MTSAVPLDPPVTANVVRVALIGNPNTGKSTLFGALSGVAVRIGNYPGVTVEKRTSRIQWQSQTVELIDLPGTYSLAPRSPDELVAVEVLTDRLAHADPVDVIVCVVNAMLLERNLFLLSQLLELGKPLVIAVNMADVAEARGRLIDAAKLSEHLGVPVVLTAAARRKGLETLRATIIRTHELALAQPREFAKPVRSLPNEFYSAVQSLGDSLSNTPSAQSPEQYLLERAVLDIGGAAERRLVKQYGSPIRDRLTKTRREIEQQLGSLADLESGARYQWIRHRLTDVVQGPELGSTWTDRLDVVLTGRWTGMILFAVLMLLVFQLIFTGSAWPMMKCEVIQGWCGEQIKDVMAPGMLRSLIIDGVISGVGGVLIFVPQIALLFLIIAVLEDCGYIARAAYLSDRLMSLLGLSGKSFLPLISSFGCAVPGIMATRVIENRRDRLVTIMIAPLMSCSARLPVYMLMIGAFVPATSLLSGLINLQALVLVAMYAVGAIVAIPTAWLLQRTMLAGETAPFILELPEYKFPDWRNVLSRVWEAVREFIARAGSLIFAATILIWAMGYLPGDHLAANRLRSEIEAMREAGELTTMELARQESIRDQLNVQDARLLEMSYLGITGHAIEPLVRPLGWDWKIGVGALASFPAREVIIATLGTIYSLGGDVEAEAFDESGQTSGLVNALRAAKWPDGRPIYTIAVALSVMVFFALCAQCVSTLLIMKKETNSWRWPVFSFFYMTILAYFGAMLTFQVANRLGL